MGGMFRYYEIKWTSKTQ